MRNLDKVPCFWKQTVPQVAMAKTIWIADRLLDLVLIASGRTSQIQTQENRIPVYPDVTFEVPQDQYPDPNTKPR